MKLHKNNILFRVYWILLVYELLLTHTSHALCSIPSAFVGSTWHDSSHGGSLTFNVTNMHGWSFTVSGTTSSDWTCASNSTFNSDGRMIFVTTQSINVYSTNLSAYLCITLTKVTDSSYRYYINNKANSDVNYERLYLNQLSTITNPTIACNDSAGASGAEYQMMIKSGSESLAKIRCPWFLLGRYGYRHTSSSNTTTCNSATSEWSMCSDSQLMSFNYTACSTKVAYSVSNTVWCVGNIVVGDTNYAMVYNGNDNTNVIDNHLVYMFSCFAISGSLNSTSISPKFCQDNQNPSQIPKTANTTNNGALMSIISKERCVTCPILTIQYGSVQVATKDSVTTVTYACNVNYQLWGTSSRTCLTNNSWSDIEPTCSCVSPTAPNYGNVSVNANGSIASYACGDGYVLKGLTSRTCQSSTATWLGSDPTCVNAIWSCTFPTDIRGTWVSTDKGVLNFTEDTLWNYPLSATASIQQLTFQCYVKSGNKYLLKSSTSFELFSSSFNAYVCLEFHPISDYKYWYQVGNDEQVTTTNALERFKVSLASVTDVNMQSGCARTEPYTTATFQTLVKQAAVAEKLVESTCPFDLFHFFSNGQLTSADGLKSCTSTTLNVCDDRTQMRLTYDSSCDTSLKFVVDGLYICLLYFTNSTTGTTYVHVWNNDTVLKSGVKQINCYAYKVSNGVLSGTLYPGPCLESQTSDSVSSPGINVRYDTINETCQEQVEGESQTKYYLAIVFGALGFILIVVLSICIIYKTKCRCIKHLCKKSKIAQSGASLGAVEEGMEPYLKNPRVDQPRTVFIARKPVKLGPVIEPYLAPPPKIELLYDVEPRPTSSRLTFNKSVFLSQLNVKVND